MRFVLAAALAALLATPVEAQSLMDSVKSAQQTFRLGLKDDALMSGGYFDTLSADITGVWIDTGPLFAVPGTDQQISEGATTQCERVPIIIRAEAPLTLTFTYGGPAGEATTTYTYLGGTSFEGSVDASAYLKRLGLFDRLKESRAQALFALGAASGSANIYRPAPNVVVVAGQRDVPRILAKCPGAIPPPTPVARGDTAALAEVLGKVFDDQLGANAKPGARPGFVACAVRVFQKLSPADIKMLVDSNFNPPPSEQQRLEAAYPGLQEDARACGDAAASQPTSTE